MDNNRRKLEGESDLEKFLANRKIDEQSKSTALNVGFELISLEKVKQNDFILSGNRYRVAVYASSFEFAKLKDICLEMKSGFAYGNYSKEDEDGFIHLRPMNITVDGELLLENVKTIPEAVYNSSQQYRVKKNDVLFNNTNSKELIGKTCLVKENISACFSNHLTRVRVDMDKAKPEYISTILIGLYKTGYFLEQSRKWIGQSGYSVKDLGELMIPLPSLDEQENIISEIESYRTIIVSAKKVLESYKATINYKDSWKSIELGEVCKFSGGTQPPKSTFIYEPKEGYIRLLQIRDFKSDDAAVYIPKTERHKTCKSHDILIGRYGPPVFQILRGKSGAYNVALIKCIPDNTKITNDWLYYFLQSKPIQQHIISLSFRSRQSGVSPDDLNKLQIPIPGLSIQNEITENIKEEEKLIDTNKLLVKIFEKKMVNLISDIWNK